MREHQREQVIQYLWNLARDAELGPRRSLHEGTHVRIRLGTFGLVAGVTMTVVLGGGITYGLIRQVVADGRISGAGIVLLPLIVGAFTAVGLWRRYRPDRRWLALHEHGLVYRANQDPPVVARWGDVVDVIDVPTRYLSYGTVVGTTHEVTVTTFDDAFTIGAQFRDVEAIGQRLVARLTELTLAEMRATVAAGGVARHRTWRADRSGLSGDGWSADWDEVVDLSVDAGTVQVLLIDDREPALDLGVGSSSTSKAFVTLIDQLRR